MNCLVRLCRFGCLEENFAWNAAKAGEEVRNRFCGLRSGPDLCKAVHDTGYSLSLTASSPEAGSSIEERAEDWNDAALDASENQFLSCLSEQKPLTNQKPSKIAKAACLC